VLVILLVLAFALVVPVVGPSGGGAHDLVAVHLILPHHHDTHAGHGEPVVHKQDADAAATAIHQPAVSAAGPVADAAGVAGKGLLAAALIFGLAVAFLSLTGMQRQRSPRQRWDTVPTGPPR
jgi:hypothetical protein